MDSWFAHFILINNPALELFIPFLLTASFLHNLVDGQMLQTSVLTENFAVTCLSHARGASDNYVGFVLRHEFFNVDLDATRESNDHKILCGYVLEIMDEVNAKEVSFHAL